MSSTLASLGTIRDDETIGTIAKDMPVPFLIRATGEAIALKSLHALHDIPLCHQDALIVSPHGEITCMAAAGIEQGVLASDAVHVHLDAHEDNLRTRDCGEDIRDADHIAAALEGYLVDPSEGTFRALEAQVSGDIATFVAGLRGRLKRVVALVRKAGNETRLYDLDTEAYCKPGAPFRKFENFGDNAGYTLQEKLQGVQSVFCSIDGDVTGARRSDGEWLAAGMEIPRRRAFDCEEQGTWFQGTLSTTMRILQNNIGPVSKQAESVLYGVSVDPAWCLNPSLFLRLFLRDYYRQCVMSQEVK